MGSHDDLTLRQKEILKLLKEQLDIEIASFNYKNKIEGYELYASLFENELHQTFFEKGNVKKVYDKIASRHKFSKRYDDIIISTSKEKLELGDLLMRRQWRILDLLEKDLEKAIDSYNSCLIGGFLKLNFSDLSEDLYRGILNNETIADSYNALVDTWNFSKKFHDIIENDNFERATYDAHGGGKKKNLPPSSYSSTESSNLTQSVNTLTFQEPVITNDLGLGKVKVETNVDRMFSALTAVEKMHLTLVGDIMSARRQQDMSVSDLSKKSGVDADYIVKVETSEKKGSIKKLMALAIALGLSIELVHPR